MKEIGFKDYGKNTMSLVLPNSFKTIIYMKNLELTKKGHLSSLILSGKISREEALKVLNQNPMIQT